MSLLAILRISVTGVHQSGLAHMHIRILHLFACVRCFLEIICVWNGHICKGNFEYPIVAPPFVAHIIAWMQCVVFIVTKFIYAPTYWVHT